LELEKVKLAISPIVGEIADFDSAAWRVALLEFLKGGFNSEVRVGG